MKRQSITQSTSENLDFQFSFGCCKVLASRIKALRDAVQLSGKGNDITLCITVTRTHVSFEVASSDTCVKAGLLLTDKSLKFLSCAAETNIFLPLPGLLNFLNGVHSAKHTPTVVKMFRERNDHLKVVLKGRTGGTQNASLTEQNFIYDSSHLCMSEWIKVPPHRIEEFTLVGSEFLALLGSISSLPKPKPSHLTCSFETDKVTFDCATDVYKSTESFTRLIPGTASLSFVYKAERWKVLKEAAKEANVVTMRIQAESGVLHIEMSYGDLAHPYYFHSMMYPEELVELGIG